MSCLMILVEVFNLISIKLDACGMIPFLLSFLINFNYEKSSVVNQFYDPTLMPSEFVMRGNSAIMKCSIPSFVADFVYVTAWIDDEGIEIVPSEDAMSESASKSH